MINSFIYIFLNTTITLLLIKLSWTDIKKRIISNKIILFILLVIIPLTWLKYEQVFIIPALITLTVGFLLFTIRVIGAGDVKLISVLMLSLPNEQIFPFYFFTAFCGLLLIIVGWYFFRKSIKQNGLPYGVAISLGYLINLILFS